MYKKLAQMIKESRCTVFFGGAGVSTESGIPDFRSADGLYSETYGRLKPETIISHRFFESNARMFYEFYKDKMVYPEAKPNDAHIALSKLEREGYLSGVITQNIDGLHTEAGSERVLELHGSVLRNHCLSCGEFYGLDAVMDADGIPRCACGGIIKPDVVLYGEQLPVDVCAEASSLVAESDLMIVAGTSLTVYPAANYVRYFGGRLVIINRDPTPFDDRAELVFHESVGDVLSKAVAEMGL